MRHLEWAGGDPAGPDLFVAEAGRYTRTEDGREGSVQREQGPARDWLLTAEERAFVTEKATRRRLGFALQPRFTNTWTVPAPRPSNQAPDEAHFAATRSRGLLVQHSLAMDAVDVAFAGPVP